MERNIIVDINMFKIMGHIEYMRGNRCGNFGSCFFKNTQILLILVMRKQTQQTEL